MGKGLYLVKIVEVLVLMHGVWQDRHRDCLEASEGQRDLSAGCVVPIKEFWLSWRVSLLPLFVQQKRCQAPYNRMYSIWLLGLPRPQT